MTNCSCRSFCKERREWITLDALLKIVTGGNVVSYKEREERWDSLFCFGYRKGKSMAKRTNFKWITFIKSESLPSLFTLRLHSLPSIFTISPKRAKRAKRTKRAKKAKKWNSNRAKEWMSEFPTLIVHC